MWNSRWLRAAVLGVLAASSLQAADTPQPPPAPTDIPDRQLPAVLADWQSWALWDENPSPPLFNDAGQKIAVWPSRMVLNATATGAEFSVTLRVFHDVRTALPGGNDHWPQDVTLNGQPAPVTPQDGRPSIRLTPGIWEVRGRFQWATMPQQLHVPPGIGLLALTVDGSTVPFPAWDAAGQLWLRRDRVSDEAERDFVSVQVYRVIEDGIPMWLRSEIELTVSGKNREEAIGAVLPAGWKLSSVNAPIPVFVDQNGEMKAQVRPGRWVVQVDAFRLDSPAEVAYAGGIKPAVSDELIGFRARPELRLVEVTGIPAVDVSQTTFPQKWRDLPVYRWETQTPFGLAERQRGTGLQQPAELTISRQLWLDEDGGGITVQDQITGGSQEIWRLDAAPGLLPGSIQVNGEGQLITRNPETGTPGVEIRTRDLSMIATGRVDGVSEFSATGWQTDTGGLSATLMLPPGWRLFAAFGPDEVDGEWISSWSLLDLFLLLVFSVAVFRIWGAVPGVLAFLAFAVSYHEPNAPHFLWLALLVPLALLRVIPAGVGRNLVLTWKWLTVLALAFALIPFLSQQVQQLIYPQLESNRNADIIRPMSVNESSVDAMHFEALAVTASADAAPPSRSAKAGADVYSRGSVADNSSAKSNLAYAAGARIQTGPGVPEWGWRAITMRWNGPVQADQVVNPILIPMGVERVITFFRIVLLLLLAGLLLDARRLTTFLSRPKSTVAATLLAAFVLLSAPQALAQIPDNTLIETLRQRLVLPSDAFPNAAEIPSATLAIAGNRITVTSEIHVAEDCAVPLPGRLPSWSPVSITVNGTPAAAATRHDGFLWVALPAGVHTVVMEGIISEAPDWEWSFALKPRRIVVDALDWNVSGINADGVPESQVFLARKQKTDAGEATYDRQDLDSVAVVERAFELGLVWQVRTTVRRLSPRGRAIELRIPLVPGERILSSNLVLDGNLAEIRIGGNEDSVSWNSELPAAESITLTSAMDSPWVERWTLVAAPTWNLTFSGIAPIFESASPNLVPTWSPWPGESVTWKITRPEAEQGATLTIDRAQHTISVGSRQRTSELSLTIRSSLGEEFSIVLPESAEVTSLAHDGKPIPVRLDGGRIILPLRPGAQNVTANWRTNTDAGFHVQADPVILPAESANVTTAMVVGPDRWILWTQGPLRGPAVRFWIVLAVAVTAGWILGSIPGSPLKRYQWMLLAVGLTQVPLAAALFVAGWFFLFVWRGLPSFERMPVLLHNIIQVLAVLATGVLLLILIWVVGAGLLGNPEMFILGNGSRSNFLQWYQDRCAKALSQPGYFSISIWWYRLSMLLWALWLAGSLLRWLWWAWARFTLGGVFRRRRAK